MGIESMGVIVEDGGRTLDGYDNLNHPDNFDVGLYKGNVTSKWLDERKSISDPTVIDLIKEKSIVDKGNDYATEAILKETFNRNNDGHKKSFLFENNPLAKG